MGGSSHYGGSPSHHGRLNTTSWPITCNLDNLGLSNLGNLDGFWSGLILENVGTPGVAVNVVA